MSVYASKEVVYKLPGVPFMQEKSSSSIRLLSPTLCFPVIDLHSNQDLYRLLYQPKRMKNSFVNLPTVVSCASLARTENICGAYYQTLESASSVSYRAMTSSSELDDRCSFRAHLYLLDESEEYSAREDQVNVDVVTPLNTVLNTGPVPGANVETQC